MVIHANSQAELAVPVVYFLKVMRCVATGGVSHYCLCGSCIIQLWEPLTLAHLPEASAMGESSDHQYDRE